MHLSTIPDALIFISLHSLQKGIASQYIPSDDLDIARWKSTPIVDLV